MWSPSVSEEIADMFSLLDVFDLHDNTNNFGYRFFDPEEERKAAVANTDAWRKKNRERRNATARAARARNPEAYKAAQKRWREKQKMRRAA